MSMSDILFAFAIYVYFLFGKRFSVCVCALKIERGRDVGVFRAVLSV